ncbi:unnamed protein product, partial [Phaeothamnion confervicola]
ITSISPAQPSVAAVAPEPGMDSSIKGIDGRRNGDGGGGGGDLMPRARRRAGFASAVPPAAEVMGHSPSVRAARGGGGDGGGGGGGGTVGGFSNAMAMLRSLTTGDHMAAMVRCMARRAWLSDSQIRDLLQEFNQSQLREERETAFVVLLPNVRQNQLKAAADAFRQLARAYPGLLAQQLQLPAVASTAGDVDAVVAAAGKKFPAGACWGDALAKPKPAAATAAARTAAAAAAMTAAANRSLVIRRGGLATAAATGAAAPMLAPVSQEESEAKRERCAVEALWHALAALDAALLGGAIVPTLARYGLPENAAPALELSVQHAATSSPLSPGGHHSLNLLHEGDRNAFQELLRADRAQRLLLKGADGLMDPSQHGNWHFFRNFDVAGGRRKVKFQILSAAGRGKAGNGRKTRSVKSDDGKGNRGRRAIVTGTGAAAATGVTAAEGKASGKKIKAKLAAGATPLRSLGANWRRAGSLKSGSRRSGKSGGSVLTKASAARSKASTASPTKGSTAAVSKSAGPEKPRKAPAATRYPALPSHCRIELDFVHCLRPPAGATPLGTKAFGALEAAASAWAARDGANAAFNAFRSISHNFYFSCHQVLRLMAAIGGSDEGQRSDIFCLLRARCCDDHHLDLCIGAVAAAATASATAPVAASGSGIEGGSSV